MKALQLPPWNARAFLALGLVTCLAWPTIAAAQSPTQPSLAEIAKKEAERRKNTKDAKKVITAKDLPESARKTPSTPAEGGTAAAAAGDQKTAAGTSTAAPDDKGEAEWRGRISLAREELRRNEVFLQALQTRVNALTRDLANADTYQRLKVNQDQQQALSELEKVKADIELSKKHIADIEEDARKAGVPPGWLR